MAVYIDSADTLHDDQEHGLALTCPHCQVFSHLTSFAVPSFAAIATHQPKTVGVVYRCDACNASIFLRYAVKHFGANRIELSAAFSEVERAKEKFAFNQLPDDIEVLFREALACYGAGALNAFASMCRRVAQATFVDLGEAGKLRLFDQLNQVRDLADIDPATFSLVKRVIFDTDVDSRPSLPRLDAYQAGVLLEVMKDLMHQAYVRRARLQQAMQVRKYFVEEPSESNITPFPKSG